MLLCLFTMFQALLLRCYCGFNTCYIFDLRCAPLTVNWPRQQHEVEVVGPVPLSFVEDRSLLHQVLQVSGIHLQPSDHVIHVALIFLVMNFTRRQWKESKGVEGTIQNPLKLTKNSFLRLKMRTSYMARTLYGKNSDYLIIFPSKFSTFLKSGLFSGSSSQQLFINMYT